METIKEPVLLTFDSLDCQSRLSFRNKLASTGTQSLLGRRGSSTHVWQGVDRGVGKDYKWLFLDEQTQHLLQGRRGRRRR